MTVPECYAAIGGNYEEALSRLRNDEKIKKFLKMFLADASFESLGSALAAKDTETAFRAAHTLKGVCMNLSLTTLFRSANAITEALRNRTDYGSDLDALYAGVKTDYDNTVANINQLD